MLSMEWSLAFGNLGLLYNCRLKNSEQTVRLQNNWSGSYSVNASLSLNCYAELSKQRTSELCCNTEIKNIRC